MYSYVASWTNVKQINIKLSMLRLRRSMVSSRSQENLCQVKVTSGKTPYGLTQQITKKTVQEPKAFRASRGIHQLPLNLTQLLNFLGRYQANCPKLQMNCPLFGVPLPYIDIDLDSSVGLNAKIEFSLRLTEAFMRDMFASRAATTEVSQ